MTTTSTFRCHCYSDARRIHLGDIVRQSRTSRCLWRVVERAPAESTYSNPMVGVELVGGTEESRCSFPLRSLELMERAQ